VTDDKNRPDENKLIAERRAKLAALREQGNAFPNDFRRNAIAEELHRTFEAHDKETLEGEAVEVSVSGRMMAKRVMGKASFIKLQDRSGQIQVRLERDRLPEGVYQAFKKWDVGDIVGARGTLFRTNTGELTVMADEVRLLTKSLRPLPEKWAGLSDQETRYRQRYVDLIINEKSRETFRKRSEIITYMRGFLESLDFLEVETPMMQVTPGGAIARPFTTHHNALDMPLYLRIAPELNLKRLVVGGMERVFELGRVFRNEGMSTRHNPEFTMLELYWAYADYTDIMILTEELVAGVADDVLGSTLVTYDGREVDLSTPWRRATMTELIAEHAGVEIGVDTPRDELVAVCDRFGVEVKPHYGPGKLVLEIYETTVEGNLWGPVFVTDYPTEVSPLSRAHRERPGYTERFEAIVAGRELCNAFSELVDPVEQRERFEGQEGDRDAGDDEAMRIDEDYLRAMEYGLPPTGGLGIGVDRLVMLLTDTTTIRDVVLFPTLRAEQTVDDVGGPAPVGGASDEESV
jgi:lysyl-tRNA synthetase class 2